MVGKLKELNEDMEGAIRDLNRILDRSNRSQMTNTSFDRLSTHISDALEAFRISIDTNDIIIEDLEDSVSNDRNRNRPNQNVNSQFNSNNP
jgi:hypothetical protein